MRGLTIETPTDVILKRRSILQGRTIVDVSGGVDSDGDPWTVLSLDNGTDLHISDAVGWVFVQPTVQ